MKRSIAAGLCLSVAVLTGGCATKNYGRLQPLSSMEMNAYSCRDIALEMSKVDAYEEQIKDQSGFNGRSAMGILGDFGLGNAMEKRGAQKSAIERRRQLEMLSAQKGCTPAPAAVTAPPSPAATPAT